GIKSVEIGAGKDIAAMKGSRANDSLYFDEDGTLKYGSNNSGGISGGISTGAPIVVRAAVKPTPSIYQKQSTIDFYKNVNREIELKGRFDANFTPRAMAAAVSMIRIMLADNLLQMNFVKF
ncbi:MAG TPA: chorismate synthase, partial [Candidatus Wallbacteria bacterium]|nr:chorismate synthase [Candidatus Wallbacteria bacterium]